MNIANLHVAEKLVSAVKIDFDSQTDIKAIRILKNEVLAKHITKIPAVLICISGEAFFESEKGEKLELKSGDFVTIEPNVIHWVTAVEESQLLLVK